MAAIPVFVAAFVLSATAMGSRFAMAQLDPTGPVDLWAASNSGLRDDGGLSKRLIVSYKEKGILDQGSLLGSTRSNDIESAQVLSRAAGIELVVLSDTADAKEVAYRIAQDPLVSYVEPDQMVSILSYEPNDPWLQEGRMWNLEDVQAPEAWEFLKSVDREGVDVVVCVIDTGIDYTHPDLIDNLWTNEAELNGTEGVDDDGNGYVDDIYGINTAYGTGNPWDDQGHGTHCAGTLAAKGNNSEGVIGVAGPGSNVKIMSCKFISFVGTGSLSAALECLEYALRMGAKITSNSWGGSAFSYTFGLMMETLQEAGQLFFAAAGNSGSNNDIYPFYPSGYWQDIVTSVASTRRDQQISTFSNYGAFTVDLGAPGEDIWSTYPVSLSGQPDPFNPGAPVDTRPYKELSGTSMATPLVAGIAAVLYTMDPTMPAHTVKQIIMLTVDPRDVETAAGGRVNMLKALQLVGGNLPSPPPPAGVEYNSPAQWFPPSVASIDDDLQYGPFDLVGRHLYFHYSPSSGYRACRTRGSTRRFPYEVTSAAVIVPLGDDSYARYVFPAGFQFPFYGEKYDDMYVSSNGFITFGSGDFNWFADLPTHYQFPRISALFSDLRPNTNFVDPLGSSITIRMLPRIRSVAITFDNVPEWYNAIGDANNDGIPDSLLQAGRNSFQIILSDDGSIKIAFKDVNHSGSIVVGVSPGGGIPASDVYDRQIYRKGDVCTRLPAQDQGKH